MPLPIPNNPSLTSVCQGAQMCPAPEARRRCQAQIAVALALLAAGPCGAISGPRKKEEQLLAPGSTVEAPVPAHENAIEAACPPGTARDSPWLALQQCTGPQHHALLRIAAVETGPHFWSEVRWDQMLGIVIFVFAVCFAVFSIKDIHCFIVLLISSSEQRGAESVKGKGDELSAAAKRKEADEREEWSITGLILLTLYRFYTGFNSATWLPYLLAMEGQSLWSEKQALFMALAKLIYGLSILMNPIFGFVGDEAVAVSHGVGRRLFIRAGLSLTAVGLYICVLAGRDGGFLSFLSGILLWRLGEALNDVTTEALVPEMVPPSQFQVASAIKASSFLLGGLLGYVLLMVFAEVHYSWLYYAYPIGMFLTSLPPLYLLNENRPIVHAKTGHDDQNFLASMVKAYVAPMRYPGGFPYACLAVFVFSLGTAPMFFLLLIVRDLVGVTDAVLQQQQFSVDSIVFFLSAAAGSAVVAVAKSAPAPARDGEHTADGDAAPIAGGEPARTEGGAQRAPVNSWAMPMKGRLLVGSMLLFGIIVFIMPGLTLFKEEHTRCAMLIFIAVLFGAAFGAAFTLFQDLTWQLLPVGVRVANSMGFSVMSRLFGVGLGNFISGMILDLAYSDATLGYKTWGYVVMHTFSGIVVLASVPIALKVVRMAREDLAEPVSARTAVPAA